MDIRVESYVGDNGMAMPRRFYLHQYPIDVVDVIDQWYGVDYRYIKVQGDDGALYILRVEEQDTNWHLTMFQSVRAQLLSPLTASLPSTTVPAFGERPPSPAAQASGS
jgi:hypothetical protein